MREPGEEWEDALFRTAPQVNSRVIEHLGYSSVEIITEIQPLTSIERKIWVDSVPTELKVPTEEQMFPLAWDYMARRIDIREDVYGRSVRKKEQGKIQYDKGVKTQYLKPGDFVLFKDLTPHLGKLTESWRGPFIIDTFGGDHGDSYVLKTLDGEPAPNTHHGDHLRIFRPQEGYLRPADEVPLQVTRNLRYRRKNDWGTADCSAPGLFVPWIVYSPACYMQIVTYRLFYTPPRFIFILCAAAHACRSPCIVSFYWAVSTPCSSTPLGAADLSEGELWRKE